MEKMTSKTKIATPGLPRGYVNAQWRCTTALDVKRKRMGVAFTFDDFDATGTLRLAIDVQSAWNLAQSILEYLDAQK